MADGATVALARLPIACCVFSLGVSLAWFLALYGKHKMEGTLSEMFYNWNKPAGKAFCVTTLFTAVLLFSTNYQYVLRNAYVTPWKMTCRRLRDVSTLAIGIVGMIPVVQPYVAEADDTKVEMTPDAIKIQTVIHLSAAMLAFGLFASAELIVLCCHFGLSRRERWWRSVACASMFAAILLFVFHHVQLEKMVESIFKDKAHDDSRILREAWQFRYELSIGSALVWQLQLIWAFARCTLHDENDSSEESSAEAPSPADPGEIETIWLWPWSYMFQVVALIFDVGVRESSVKKTWLLGVVSIVEVIIFIFSTRIVQYLLYCQVCSSVAFLQQSFVASLQQCSECLGNRYGATKP